MKKSLSAILSLAMAFSMFASVAMGAEADATTTDATATADATKDSSSFSDLKDLDAATKAKFDELIKAGVFDGVKEGVFGLKDKMNRAQFAKVASLVFGLKVDTSLKTSTFSDVKADDPANGYALPYIEALVKAGITDGYAPGQFNPAGEVTKEQLAAFLLRGLGKDSAAKATPGVSDKTVSDWAKGYVALALQLKVLSSGTDGTFGGTSAATRDLLVLGAYEAKKQYVPPVGPVVTNVSIAKAEATGAKTVKVTLNGAIADTSKLNVTLNRGSSAITAKVTWNSTKNEATIVSDSKFTEGTYTAKIEAVKDGGLTVDKGTSDITVQNEKITKIDFVTASETVGQGKAVKIDFKALNQYNEQSDLAASRFTIATSPELNATLAGDSQSITVDIVKAMNENKLVRDSLFAVTIIAPDNTAQASKTYKVGDKQSVAKVELGDVKLPSGKTMIEAGDTTSIAYKAYDQYGFEVTDLDTLRENTSTYTTAAGIVDNTTGSDNNISYSNGFDFFGDEDGDKRPELKLITKVDENAFLTDQDVTLSVVAYSSGQTASKSVKVASTKIPYEVSFGSYNKTIAWGDEDVIIPITVKDKFGAVLSADDVIRKKADLNVYPYGTAGNVRVELVDSGPDKGNVRITGLDYKKDDRAGEKALKSGSLTINATVSKSGKSATFTSTVNEKRYANQVYISSEGKPKMLPSIAAPGNTTYSDEGVTENKYKIKFKDQYGEDFDKDYTNYQLDVEFSKTSGSVTQGVYDVYFSKAGIANSTAFNTLNNTDGKPVNWKLTAPGTGGDRSVVTFVGDDTRKDGYAVVPGFGGSIKDVRDTDLRFTATNRADATGTYQVAFKLYALELNSDGTPKLVDGKVVRTLQSSVTRSSELLTVDKSSDLTYTVAPITAVPSIDDVIPTSVLANVPTNTASPAPTFGGRNWFAGKVDVTAKDSSGNAVALPNKVVQSVTVTNTNAAGVVLKPKGDANSGGKVAANVYQNASDAMKYAGNFDSFGIYGKDTGTTSVTVAFKPSNYAGVKFATLDNVQIKDDALYANSLTAGEVGKTKEIYLGELNGLLVFSGNTVSADKTYTRKMQTFGDIKIKDQYGFTEFKNHAAIAAGGVFGLQFAISNAKWTGEPGTIEVDMSDAANGVAKYKYADGANGSKITSFTATVLTANGKSQTVLVNVNPAK